MYNISVPSAEKMLQERYNLSLRDLVVAELKRQGIVVGFQKVFLERESVYWGEIYGERVIINTNDEIQTLIPKLQENATEEHTYVYEEENNA